MRQARLKMDDQPTWYHCYNRISGTRHDLPFGDAEKEQFVRILKRVSLLYTVEVAAYQVMSNHYHLILYAPADKPGPEEVCKRYRRFYGGKRTLRVGSPACEQWQERCRDISWFMRHVQQLFAVWYNRTRQVERRGSLWADRFKHSLLEDGQAVWKCSAYVENNGVRAGLAASAGRYRFGSYGVWRQTGRHPFDWTVRKRLLPMLRDVLGIEDMEGLASAMEVVLGSDEEPTVHSRVRYWTNGLVIGSKLYLLQVMSRREPAERLNRHRVGRLDDTGLCSWRNVRPASV